MRRRQQRDHVGAGCVDQQRLHARRSAARTTGAPGGRPPPGRARAATAQASSAGVTVTSTSVDSPRSPRSRPTSVSAENCLSHRCGTSTRLAARAAPRRRARSGRRGARPSTRSSIANAGCVGRLDHAEDPDLVAGGDQRVGLGDRGALGAAELVRRLDEEGDLHPAQPASSGSIERSASRPSGFQRSRARGPVAGTGVQLGQQHGVVGVGEVVGAAPDADPRRRRCRPRAGARRSSRPAGRRRRSASRPARRARSRAAWPSTWSSVSSSSRWQPGSTPSGGRSRRCTPVAAHVDGVELGGRRRRCAGAAAAGRRRGDAPPTGSAPSGASGVRVERRARRRLPVDTGPSPDQHVVRRPGEPGQVAGVRRRARSPCLASASRTETGPSTSSQRWTPSSTAAYVATAAPAPDVRGACIR